MPKDRRPKNRTTNAGVTHPPSPGRLLSRPNSQAGAPFEGPGSISSGRPRSVARKRVCVPDGFRIGAARQGSGQASHLGRSCQIRSRSSDGKSIRFLTGTSQVRVLPGPVTKVAFDNFATGAFGTARRNGLSSAHTLAGSALPSGRPVLSATHPSRLSPETVTRIKGGYLNSTPGVVVAPLAYYRLPTGLRERGAVKVRRTTLLATTQEARSETSTQDRIGQFERSEHGHLNLRTAAEVFRAFSSRRPFSSTSSLLERRPLVNMGAVLSLRLTPLKVNGYLDCICRAGAAGAAIFHEVTG